MNTLVNIIFIGAGATAMVDLWAVARRRLLGVPLPNYGFVGRWIAHFGRGRLRHESIAAAAAVRGERTLGWIVHFLTGVVFAAILPAVWGSEWLRAPRLIPALIVGILTAAAPFFVMQPAMGAGIAASRTPRPRAARLQTLVTHATFGLGLYVAALIARTLISGE